MSKNNGQYRNIRALTGNTAFSNNVRKSFAIGAILGPLLGLDWQLVEWGPSSPDVLPNKTPYSDVSGMKSNGAMTGNNIAKFYTV